MAAEKVTVACGVLTNHKHLGGLLGTLRGSELAKHLAKPTEVIFVDEGFQVTLYVKDYADFLIRSSLEYGMLHPWSAQFKTEGPA
ncbi:MAG: hypothetical protein A2937_02335 [Candidatus Yonathbacteria bacterium RIFCSPLOWO2_01_FULL_47_33b]|uniref:Uncharacterized protein n=1 Tax=Candidatus Yonathbacteria bacterium RIFCSPLOWO2_01_FULL_47_33b TaxID=1802727 RepID=A0A1G2SDE5_9BACT|nr:MAG: hypothetical protein A2937_02335 [Candidatus Yonathbacteria bacterium RIFCSPLOWO2_01_FULL_47_33b]